MYFRSTAIGYAVSAKPTTAIDDGAPCRVLSGTRPFSRLTSSAKYLKVSRSIRANPSSDNDGSNILISFASKVEESANGARYKSQGKARSEAERVAPGKYTNERFRPERPKYALYYALSGLDLNFDSLPGATRFALAPGFHISRRWRCVATFGAKQCPHESVDHDPNTQAQVVLSRALYDEWRAYCLIRSWNQNNPGLLITPIDDVPVYLNNSQIESLVQLDIEAATKGHRKTRLIGMKVADAEYCGKLWAIDVHLLNSDAKKGMPKWLESWSIFGIVFYLNATEKVLERRIDRAASSRTRKIVFAEMKRVIKLGPYIFVEIDTSRQIKAAQGLLFSQDIIDCCVRCIAGEVVNIQRGIATEEFILLVIVLRQRTSRED